MTDFKKALEEGISAAQKADFERKQIEEVLEELDRQIAQATGDKVRIQRMEIPPSLVDFFRPEARRESSYWAIAAYSTKVPDKSEKELAKWSVAPSGYPCKVAWGNTIRYCEDRESLELTLADLLRDPEVGQKIHSLMEPGPVPPKSAAPEQEVAIQE
jgi:hypothetical protein